MKKTMNVILIIVAVFLVVWSAGSYFFERSVESPAYSVLEEKNGYEIRLYESYITAQVEVSGTYDETLGEGFRLLADYIFGNNTKQTDIAMTAPVTESETQSEKMAMTAPVIESGDEQIRTVSFVMPFEYTLDTLPRPNNPAVKIVQQNERKMAVLRFSWYRGEERVANKKQELLSLLERDGIEAKGKPEYAGYNAPFSAPWLNRNEVMIEVE